MRSSVVNFVKAAFFNDEFLDSMNDTLISLIPKIDSPETMSNFLFIALCDVISKIITKVIANRIKPLMSKLVRENQASFIHRRQAADNSVILQEMINSMKRKEGIVGVMAVKIDLEKAYDKIHWSFRKELLVKVGFDIKLI